MDVVRFRLDGKVDLSKRTRVYASCPYAVYGDILTLNCEVFGESLVIDLLLNSAQHSHELSRRPILEEVARSSDRQLRRRTPD